MDISTTPSIKRKPVPRTVIPQSSPDANDIIGDLLDDYLDDYHEPPNPNKGHDAASEKGELAVTLTTHRPDPPRQLSLPLVRSPSELSVNSSATAPSSPLPNRSLWKTAVNETIYFAGGLVSHPYESTKHYSILRHSAAVVFYKGSSTSVAITIFADGPLPADRSFWLQRKGFSGNMGMAASALLRTQGNWIDVTPTLEALASDIPESDERAWQRDIKKFLKKAASQKNLSKQTTRETCIIRIPVLAEDGYLRVVMCTGEGSKKVLCPSPVFRVASTSSDVSVLRGASLSTMPIELGLKVASVVGSTAVERYIGPARDAIQSQVERLQTKVEPYMPGFIVQEAGIMAYETVEESFEPERDATYDPLRAEGDLEAAPVIIGADSGPEKPYPVRFTGKVVLGTGRSKMEVNLPTANLNGVPSDLLLRLNGIYIGWAAIQRKDRLGDISSEWHAAVITVGPSPYGPPQVIAKNVVAVHIVHDFGETAFFNANLQVVIMAYLRSMPKVDRSQPRAAHTPIVTRDIKTAVASLDRENWQCDTTLHRVKTEMSTMSLEERYVDIRTKVQKRVDSVPLHLAGVRTSRAELRDVAHGRGGIYIRR